MQFCGITLIRDTLIKSLQISKEIYPDVKVEIFHGANAELLNNLSDNIIDMVLMNLPTESNDNIRIEKIEDVKDIFVAKTSVFGEYKNKILSFEDLNNLPLVFQQSTSTARKFLDGIISKNKTVLKPEYELGSYSLVLDFVKEGLGIGFVNKKHVKEELDSNELFEIKTDFDIPNREIGVAINKKSASNKTLNKFIEIMKENQ
jgi:DNA-binding transcriptional LysR family regulator